MYCLTGTNKKATLFTKEGGYLIDIVEKNDWIWCARMKPKDYFTAISTNDGDISLY